MAATHQRPAALLPVRLLLACTIFGPLTASSLEAQSCLGFSGDGFIGASGATRREWSYTMTGFGGSGGLRIGRVGAVASYLKFSGTDEFGQTFGFQNFRATVGYEAITSSLSLCPGPDHRVRGRLVERLSLPTLLFQTNLRRRTGAGSSLWRTEFQSCHDSLADRHSRRSRSRAAHRRGHPDTQQRNGHRAARRSHGGTRQGVGAALRRTRCRRQRLAEGGSTLRPDILTVALNRLPGPARHGSRPAGHIAARIARSDDGSTDRRCQSEFPAYVFRRPSLPSLPTGRSALGSHHASWSSPVDVKSVRAVDSRFAVAFEIAGNSDLLRPGTMGQLSSTSRTQPCVRKLG